MKRLSLEQVNEYLDDEWKAYEDYKSKGLTKMASDEARHHKFWLKKRKEWYGY